MRKKILWEYLVAILGGILTSIIWYVIIQKSITKGIAIAIITGVVLWFFIWCLEKVYAKLLMSRFPEILAMYKSQSQSNDDMIHLLKTASKLDILTIRGLGIIGLNDSALRNTLHSTGGKRVSIRVFMLSPESKYVKERAKETNESYEAFKNALNLGIERVQELKNSTTHNIKIFLYDQKPCWRIIRIDDFFFMSVFDGETEGHRAGVYKIDGTRNGTIGKALKRYFDSMEEQSKELS